MHWAKLELYKTFHLLNQVWPHFRFSFFNFSFFSVRGSVAKTCFLQVTFPTSVVTQSWQLTRTKLKPRVGTPQNRNNKSSQLQKSVQTLHHPKCLGSAVVYVFSMMTWRIPRMWRSANSQISVHKHEGKNWASKTHHKIRPDTAATHKKHAMVTLENISKSPQIFPCWLPFRFSFVRLCVPTTDFCGNEWGGRERKRKIPLRKCVIHLAAYFSGT